MTDERVIILAPSGRDAPLTAETLTQAGLHAEGYSDVELFMVKLYEATGAAVVAQEALTPNALQRLVAFVNAQPAWSDFPFIVVTSMRESADVSASRYSILRQLGNLTILERPFHLETLITAVQSALRARRRQYQARDYLREREEREEAIQELNQNLERKVQERTQELASSQYALSQAQRLEGLGRLAGGVAHDFNNLMTGILGIMSDLAETVGTDPAVLEDIRQVTEAAQKASQLTRQLLALGRRQVALPMDLDVNVVISEMSKMFSRLLPESIDVVIRLADEPQAVRMDRNQLEQVLMNIVLNARDAIGERGSIHVATSAMTIPETRVVSALSLPPGNYVTIRVSDTGSGMAADVLVHVFEPFYTTKESGKGTGLGLATVYGILKQNGGDVTVSSHVGAGTTFTIYLPRLASLEVENIVGTSVHNTSGTETILVVEDEDIVRHVVVRALTKAGYEVLQASSGADAIKVCQSFPRPIHLLLTDVVMPGMNGRQLAESLECSHRGMKVLFMSGHTEDVIMHQGMLEPGICFIEKTFSPALLCRRVRETLDATATGPFAKS